MGVNQVDPPVLDDPAEPSGLAHERDGVEGAERVSNDLDPGAVELRAERTVAKNGELYADARPLQLAGKSHGIALGPADAQTVQHVQHAERGWHHGYPDKPPVRPEGPTHAGSGEDVESSRAREIFIKVRSCPPFRRAPEPARGRPPRAHLR